MLQKIDGPLVGPLFAGSPVRPNLLNMLKSATGWILGLGPIWVCGSGVGAEVFLPFSRVEIKVSTQERPIVPYVSLLGKCMAIQ